MTESVQTADTTDEDPDSLPIRAVNAYLSLGWFDRIGVAAMIIMALGIAITLLGQAVGGLI